MKHQRILLSIFLSGLVSLGGAAFAQSGRAPAARDPNPSTGAVLGGNTPTDVALNEGNQIGHVSGTIVSLTSSGVEIKTDTGNRNFVIDNRTNQADGLATGAVVTIYFDKNTNGHDRALRVVSGQSGAAPTGAPGASDMNRPDPRAAGRAPTDSIAPTPRAQTTTGTGSTRSANDTAGSTDSSSSTYGSQTGSTGNTGATTGTATGSYGSQTGSTTGTTGDSGSTYGTRTGSTDTAAGSSYGSNTADTTGTRGGTLPRTASDMPLVGLAGLLALTSGLALALRRRS